MSQIDIGKNFSPTPSGRYKADGPFSGEAFREKHLKKAVLKDDLEILVNLDTAIGLGSSFLEEAFGGLIRKKYISREELLRRLVLVAQDEAIIDEIKFHINSAGE